MFLKENPVQLVDNFISFLKEKLKYNSVLVIGSSFGGSVAIYLKNPDLIISISPVIDWKNLYDSNSSYNYESLKNYLIQNGYIIDDLGWEKLKSGILLPLPNEKKELMLIKSL